MPCTVTTIIIIIITIMAKGKRNGPEEGHPPKTTK